MRVVLVLSEHTYGRYCIKDNMEVAMNLLLYSQFAPLW